MERGDWPRTKPAEEGALCPVEDPWVHRSANMRCRTCMYFVRKARHGDGPLTAVELGRCRRHAPTLGGWPVVFETDWCGDHKLDEEKL